MSESGTQVDQHFMMLVVSLQAGAMQQMGKVASPISGKVERDLEAARATIDTLAMLEQKTSGNLTQDENKFLSSVLYQLRLNFVDETKKGDEKQDTGEEPKSEAEAERSEDKEKERTQSETDPDTGNQSESDSTKNG